MISDIVDDKPVLKPEFQESYANYYKKRDRVTKPGKTRVAGEDAKNLAAAFRTMFFN